MVVTSIALCYALLILVVLENVLENFSTEKAKTSEGLARPMKWEFYAFVMLYEYFTNFRLTSSHNLALWNCSE